jgi:hypothetical protein
MAEVKRVTFREEMQFISPPNSPMALPQKTAIIHLEGPRPRTCQDFILPLQKIVSNSKEALSYLDQKEKTQKEKALQGAKQMLALSKLMANRNVAFLGAIKTISIFSHIQWSTPSMTPLFLLENMKLQKGSKMLVCVCDKKGVTWQLVLVKEIGSQLIPVVRASMKGKAKGLHLSLDDHETFRRELLEDREAAVQLFNTNHLPISVRETPVVIYGVSTKLDLYTIEELKEIKELYIPVGWHAPKLFVLRDDSQALRFFYDYLRADGLISMFSNVVATSTKRQHAALSFQKWHLSEQTDLFFDSLPVEDFVGEPIWVCKGSFIELLHEDQEFYSILNRPFNQNKYDEAMRFLFFCSSMKIHLEGIAKSFSTLPTACQLEQEQTEMEEKQALTGKNDKNLLGNVVLKIEINVEMFAILERLRAVRDMCLALETV